MLFTIKDPPFNISTDKVNKLDDTGIHIVTTALKKSSFCIHYLCKRGMSVTDVAQWIDLVNNPKKPEVGTHIRYRFTLFPILPAGWTQEHAIHTFMPDVIKAHKEYYKKCTKMVFIFDHNPDTGYVNALAREQIQSYLNNYPESSLTGVEVEFAEF